jgi:hypothetical protein
LQSPVATPPASVVPKAPDELPPGPPSTSGIPPKTESCELPQATLTAIAVKQKMATRTALGTEWSILRAELKLARV